MGLSSCHMLVNQEEPLLERGSAPVSLGESPRWYVCHQFPCVAAGGSGTTLTGKGPEQRVPKWGPSHQ